MDNDARPAVVDNIVAQMTGNTGLGISSRTIQSGLMLDYNLVWNWPLGNYNSVNSGGSDLSADPAFENYDGDNFHLSVVSPAIDHGGGALLPADDRDGTARPQGSAADIGAYEHFDALTIPSVLSILCADANPTNASSVDFTVTFSESVTGVDVTDFIPTNTGSLTGATVNQVTGTGDTYTVSVYPGTGNGILRLDVPVSVSITDLAGNSLGGLPYTSGESYYIVNTTPVLIDPADTAVLHTNRPIFEWTNFPDATQYQIQVQPIPGSSRWLSKRPSRPPPTLP